MAYRVTYPLISCDAQREFATEAEARKFAADYRVVIESSPHVTIHAWRRIKVEEVR